MDKHFLQNGHDLRFTPSTFNGNDNYVPCLAENTLYKYPQWIECQQLAPHHVNYPIENGVCDGETSVNNSRIGLDEYFLNMGAHQKQRSDEVLDNAAMNISSSTSVVPTKPQRNYSRQKATDTDRRRRTRIATALTALEDILPNSKEGNKASIVDDCIDYIQYLQLHMKELSKNSLGGESTSNPFIFLKGYGHYLVHENIGSESLEEMVGNLLEVNPSAATKLLESRGLFIMPF